MMRLIIAAILCWQAKELIKRSNNARRPKGRSFLMWRVLKGVLYCGRAGREGLLINNHPLKALLINKSLIMALIMIISLSRSPKGATQAPILRSGPLKEFGMKTNQFLITLGFFARARWQKTFTSARTALSGKRPAERRRRRWLRKTL